MIETETISTSNTRTKMLNHIVELKDGKPTDKCLCGHIWDVFMPKHNGDICQECVDELKRRGQG